jgi:hypothetical protein
MKFQKAVLAAASSALLVVGSVGASELVVTAETNASRNVTMMSLDLVSDGISRGIQARVAVPKGATVDTAKCLTALPEGFQGVCSFSEGEIRLMAFAFDNRALPSGLVELGVVKVTGQLKGGAGLKVVDFQAVDAAGANIPAKASVEFGTAKPSRVERNTR